MKISLVIDYHLNNKIFDVTDNNTNRDNCGYSFWLLKKKFQDSGVDFSTCDINLPTESNIVIYFDLPDKNMNVESGAYLCLFECEVIKPRSWDVSRHSQFSKIFTWNDELVDNKKYFKINFSHKFPEDKDLHCSLQNHFSEKKFCTLISGNKKVKHKLELYTERVRTIRWFETNTTEEFDLYGFGWDKFTSTNRYMSFIVSRIPLLTKLFAPKFSSYKGQVESKFETLRNYKFAICYENARDIPGYITEKIFDCFFAGCVPVYWGAPNIGIHIPKNCFVDRRDFSSNEELYSYLKKISVEEYEQIQMNIVNYIFSTKSAPFRAETFSEVIAGYLLDDL